MYINLMFLKTQIDKLERERRVMKDYLLSKFETEDWHGVQDAGSDLRDIDSMLEAYRNTLNLAEREDNGN